MKKYLLFFSLCMQIAIPIELTSVQKTALGKKIWQNEGGGKYEMLVFWNPKESFPSLGIGHFIWYPAGHTDTYTQTFPLLLDYFKQKKVKLPPWLVKAHRKGAPWKNYDEFKLHAHDPCIEELRKLLSTTTDLQVDFIINRLDTAWERMQNYANPTKKGLIAHHFTALKQTPSGLYALIDYLNFKGEGSNPNERYDGKGWGLLQVLEAMPATVTADGIVAAFVQAADHILQERVRNAPSHKTHEQKWLVGWQTRIHSYSTFKIT